jgi:phage terminase large subunit GpA-like protein
MAVKGVDNSPIPLNSPTKVDINFRGRKISGGVRLWKVGVSIIKSELFNFLKQRKNDDGSCPNGYMHFPEYNAEYFKQLTAEQLMTRIVKGYPKREWQKTRDRNEALDCRVYARAAAIAVGIDRWSGEKRQQTAGKKPEDGYRKQSPPILPRRVVTQRPRVVRSSFM